MTDANKIERRLRKALEDGRLVELQRGVLDCVPERAFVVGVGRKWVLLQVVSSTMHLDGYQAVRRRDVLRCRSIDDGIAARALALRGEKRVIPKGIRLDRTRDVLRSATKRFRIVSVHTEYDKAGICYVGAVGRLGKKRFRLHEISTEAKWLSKRYRYRYRSISRVDFDGEYEKALLLVADAAAERG